MGIVDLRRFGDDQIVIHYGGELTSVDAYTFANSLVAFADTLRAVNGVLNPGQNIEIRLDAVGTGSFRARIKKIKKGLGGFWSRAPEQLFWAVFAAVVLTPLVTDKETVDVFDDRVEIHRGGDTIIISREAYEQLPNVRHNPEVQKHLQRAFEVIEHDEAIENFGVTPKIDDPQPLVQIPRDEFARLASGPDLIEGDGSKRRSRKENARLVILKAWLKGGKRKWSFEWNGVPLSAPIADLGFQGRLDRHEQLIGNGDAMDVVLEYYQDFDESIGTWVNDQHSFVVSTVVEYLSRGGAQGQILNGS
ncbi:hypothetical protein P9272_14650 [Mesorhizobium sp. WSM4976]|uniref:hypothetical protein n=1 Tax=Mesorhizobium sp. WSM4976 TaxID=3038549 RepID=UPI002416FCF7|nr:hypothetical protein [Mesorhizobium sp. WSM4976]MDG4894810.1 hypothetical protein [Mesorhizobium sp. WSM4976]